MNEALTKKWQQTRGLAVVSIAMNPVTLPEEDAQLIKDAQKNAILRDPTMAAATLAGAQADAMKSAASNTAGAMTGFMGMGMVQNSMGTDAQSLFAMGQQQRMQQQNEAQQLAAQEQRSVAQAGQPGQNNAAVSNEVSNGWVCECGISNTGKFCVECGKPKPQPVQGWVCSCGTVNKGKFCMECGAKKPAEAPLYKCDKCGWEPEDPKNPPKFCPECGDPFDDNDIQK